MPAATRLVIQLCRLQPLAHQVALRGSGRGIIASMSEIVFVVEDAPEGGFTARAVGESIFTEADDMAQLHVRAREAVRCHFNEGKAPKLIRLHYVRDEVIAA